MLEPAPATIKRSSWYLGRESKRVVGCTPKTEARISFEFYHFQERTD
ncbi:MAG: hypothetical protein ACJ71K_14905 [Nitrososphaeraceae archaeon]|jgi:hypothetical protein